MNPADLTDVLGAAITDALAKKGYSQLTTVQQAVLDPALVGRDLRISSQTGSGKTLAIGFIVRDLAQQPAAIDKTEKFRPARPRALVVTPTRELAKQVEQELRWLYAGYKINVASVTGGTGYRDEARGLAMNPAVVVGTPGRMLDCLNRKTIDASQVGAVVLDEADRMLDLGFREDLEAILKFPPAERRTHLVSATFAREVSTLADRVQENAARVEGTRLGAANVDIDHVIHLIAPDQRMDAMINILLADPGAQTLVFVRMRVDVSQVSKGLKSAGFAAAGLSGEMEQRERNHTLAEFKRGFLRVLVATDVAARGIDLPDVTRVIHAEPPTNADGYTHRSGRTGRAGRKGTSALLVTTAQIVPVTRILRQANIKHRFEAIPTAAQIREQNDARIVADLTTGDEATPVDERLLKLAHQILAKESPEQSVARLLSKLPEEQRIAPRELTPILPPSEARARKERPQLNARDARPSRDARPMRDTRPTRDARPTREQPPVRNAGGRKPPQRVGAQNPQGQQGQDEWVPFRVSWGQEHGADARRLLAVVCRRGDIRGTDVGAIRIQRTFSVVNVNANVADGFARQCVKPDPRDPQIRIRPDARA